MAIPGIKNLIGHDGAFLGRRVSSKILGPQELDGFVEPRKPKKPSLPKKILGGTLLSAAGTVLLGLCTLLYKGFTGPDLFHENINQTRNDMEAALGLKSKTVSHPGAVKDLILNLKEGDVITITRVEKKDSYLLMLPWSCNRTVLTGIIKPIPHNSLLYPEIQLKGFFHSISDCEIAQITIHKSTDKVELSVTDKDIEERVLKELKAVKLGSKIKAHYKSSETKIGILKKDPISEDTHKYIIVKTIEYNKSLDTGRLGFNIDVWPVNLIEKIELLELPDNSRITSPVENLREKEPTNPIDRNGTKDTHDLAEKA